MYQTLLKKHPAAVAKFELNQLDDSIFDLEDLYSGFLTQIQKVEAEVILSGNTAKSPIDTTLAKKKLASIYSNLEKKFGEQNVFLAFTFPNSLPPATSAEIIVSYYQALLDSGKENTALIIKYTMAT
ncbi:hypothetical protein Lbir_2686 [Legionella birminghamensis]|uniref:Uncharacterized protein n=2 Tax=Legionella birminghamensis TaxID=28083 RepID=A0A378I8R9_9GAMM|nr:hypothetical protein Lbir_2686 [Legionella birminghamensis]STX31206.1 Uncharacterised protein [Legionella birminghamensis]